jgi:phosphoribosylamine--glycine ligase
MEVEWDERKAITVVMAAKGYPGSYRKGTPIGSLAAAERVPGVTVFHAGTALSPEGTLLASGGRVLNVTALGDTVAEARKNAYRAAAAIDWPDGFYRRDIGWRSLVREEAS